METSKVNERIQITLQHSKNNTYKISLSTNRFSEFIPTTVIHLTPDEIEKLKESSKKTQEKIQTLATSIPPKELESFGRSLFEILFQGDVKRLFLTSLAENPIDNSISLALRIPEELASIWWELLYSDHDVAQGFFSLNETIHFSRYTGSTLWHSTAESIESLRVLAIVSQPPDQPKLDINAELNILRASIVGRNRVQFEYSDNPTIKEFKRVVHYYKPHIIHFIGHGIYEPNGTSGLIMPNETKEGSSILSSAEFANILKWRGNECSLVILNACETATVGINYQNSVAGALINAGIPAVIGMQCKIPNNIALVFSECFYAYLLDGFCQPVDYALNNARAFIQRSKIDQKLFAKYWCAPVLYSRSRDGLLFTLLEKSDEVQEFNRIYKIALSLGRLNEKSIQPVFAWLQSLGPRALPSLSYALSEGDSLTRQRAAEGLGKLEDHFANEILENQRSSEKDDSVKRAINKALEKANGSDKNDTDLPSKSSRSSQSTKPQPKPTRHPKDNSNATSKKTKRSQPEWDDILQQYEILTDKFNEAIRDSEAKLEKFKKDFSSLEKEANVYLNASKRVLVGIKRLKRWSYFQYMKGIKRLVTSKRVEKEIKEINIYIDTWNQHGTLHPKIKKMKFQLTRLEIQLEIYNKRINEISSDLEALEMKYADNNLKIFYWRIKKTQRNIQASRYKLKDSQFKNKVRDLATNLEKSGEKGSKRVKEIYGTQILTSDNKIHRIVKKKTKE